MGYIVMNETAEARAAGMHVPLRMGAPAVAGVHHAMVHPQLLDQLHGAGAKACELGLRVYYDMVHYAGPAARARAGLCSCEGKMGGSGSSWPCG